MSNLSRLPGPFAEVWEWQRQGACRGRDSAQFFHPDGERGASRTRREIAAKAVCRSCPVRPQCAAHALSAREPYGVWGGFTEAERIRLFTTGWQDLATPDLDRVDVARLEARLGLPQRRILPQHRPPSPGPMPQRMLPAGVTRTMPLSSHVLPPGGLGIPAMQRGIPPAPRGTSVAGRGPVTPR
jgi:WhiB family transcriptional regulator, redox-sensing transcriptional regulator